MGIYVSEKFIEELEQKLQMISEDVEHASFTASRRPYTDKESVDYYYGYLNGFIAASDMFLSLLSPLRG